MNIFKKHPAEVGETYFQHLKCTLKICKETLLISGIILIHGIFPFLFKDTASQKINQLNQKIQMRKNCQKL